MPTRSKMATARDFSRAFIRAYEDARSTYDRDAWIAAWKSRWSHLMLWDEKSVIRETASALGLAVARGEPLRLDAIMTLPEPPDTWHAFPARVALEHENNPWTMEKEIRVLLSVRAPLKVGITYSIHDYVRKSQDIATELADRIKREFARSRAAVGEDPATEYLFLLGVDRPSADYELDWEAMSFGAADVPPAGFTAVPKADA